METRPRTTEAKARKALTRRWVEESVSPARPLIRSAPRTVMFLPMVVLVAVLPGLYALRNWDLNPPGPWWGLRGLAVLEGRVLDQAGLPGLPPGLEEKAYLAVALQPPLYAWLEAAFLWASGDRSPVATVLPSYAAGAAVVVLVFLLGRLWRGPGVGLVAAVLTGFNRALLAQMQQATPTTLALAGALASAYGYGQFLEAGEGKRARWCLFGGVGLGVSLLAVGAMGLSVVPMILLHRAALGPASPPGGRIGTGRWWRDHPTLLAGAASLLIGLLLAGPWYAMMAGRHGGPFLSALVAPPQALGPPPSGLLARMVELAPATLPFGLYAAATALRRLLTAEGEDRVTSGGTLCLAWLAVAALTPTVLSRGPRPALNLFLMVPLNLLAGSAIADLSGRRIQARALCWLAPGSAATVAWLTSTHLRSAASDLFAMRRPDPASALGMHLALDLVLVMVVAVRGLDRWARRRDDRRLLVLGGCLGAVLAVTVVSGLNEVRFRHRETGELLALREAILRRQHAKPFTTLAVVGPSLSAEVEAGAGQWRPGGRLRFLLRAALPKLAQIDLTGVDELRRLPGGHRLVIFAGTGARLDYASQSRLGLEAIYPGRSGELEAYATRDDGGKTARR